MQINVPGKNTIYVGAQQHFVFTFSSFSFVHQRNISKALRLVKQSVIKTSDFIYQTDLLNASFPLRLYACTVYLPHKLYVLIFLCNSICIYLFYHLT